MSNNAVKTTPVNTTKLLPAPKNGGTDEKYKMPALLPDGFLDTETRYTPASVFGIVQVADGRMWEIKDTSAKALLDAKIEPKARVNHGPIEDLPIWRVDEGGEKFLGGTTHSTYAAYTVNDCVYRAVEKYIEKLGLGGFTSGDIDWFKYHPNVTSDGASRGTVLGVVQGLLYPYGIGISRVYMPVASALGEEHKVFAAALGMNPAATVTHAVSNAGFLESLGDNIDPLIAENINRTCRFEFVEEPPTPCVALVNASSTTFTKESKVNGGTNVVSQWSSTTVGFGHADYLGARDGTYGSWLIAFKLDRLQDIPYQKPELVSGFNIDISESKKKKSSSVKKTIGSGEVISVYQSKFDGRSINDINASKYNKGTKPTQGKNENVHYLPVVEDVPPIVSAKIDGKCPHCGKEDLEVLGEYMFCVSCGAWTDDDGESWETVDNFSVDKNLCPLCGSSLYDGWCVFCMYSTEHWYESKYTICPIHGTPPYVSDDSIFLCPGCLADEGIDPNFYYMSGSSMVNRMVSAIQEGV